MMIKELKRLWWGYRDIYPLRERWSRTGEILVREAAARLPKKLAYWSFIIQGTKAIRSDETVPEVTYVEVLNRI